MTPTYQFGTVDDWRGGIGIEHHGQYDLQCHPSVVTCAMLASELHFGLVLDHSSELERSGCLIRPYLMQVSICLRSAAEIHASISTANFAVLRTLPVTMSFQSIYVSF